MKDLIGERFGQYEVTGLIGQGGMSTVYRARDTKLQRDVALKVLALDMAQQEQGPLPLERAAKIIEQLAGALDYAHQRHIIHRDVKPANVMVGMNDRVTLMDFGIAKAPSEEKLTRVGQVMGTMGALAADLATALRATSGEPAVSSTAPKPVVPLKLVFPDGREQQLHPGVLRLGRAPDNDVIFNDDRVSRYHAEIRCKAQHGCAILDLGSANGTHIDGRVLRPQAFLPLKPGMCVNLGPNVALQIQPETTPRRPAEPPAWPSGSLDTTRNGDRRAAGSPSLLANPTLLIAQVATRLDDRQIALGVVGLLILAILGVWFGTPLWRVSAFVWYNVPLIGLIGALVYAATRRPWVAAVAHTLTALVGGVALWVRLAIYSERYAALLLGAAGGGLLIRAWLAFLPRIKGKAAAPWREAGWLALMAMLAVAILYGVVNVNELRRAGQWFGAAAIGGLGWFLGDIVHQYLTLRAAGRR